MPNPTDVSRFLQEVFGPDYATCAILANLHPPAHVRSVDQLDDKRDCYWSIAAFPPEATTNLGNNALNVRALVIDDVGTKGPSEGAVRLALGEPTGITITSAGNFQWAYRLTRPVAKEDWAGFFGGVEALIAHTVPLEARAAQTLMRLPMGVNTKPGKGGFAVRLVKLNPGVMLDPDTVARVAGPGPTAKASGNGSVRDIRGLLALIPNDDVDYDFWMERMQRTRALAADPDEARDAFEEWSAKSSKHDPEETSRRWGTVSPTHTSGKELLREAEAADPEGYRAWQAAESGNAFDDGVVPPVAAGMEFFADQEKSSIAVVKGLAGRLKHVGRDDWREFDETTGRWREWTGNHMMRRVLEMVHERKQRPIAAPLA